MAILIVEDDVWPPDVVAGHVQLLHSPVLAGLPLQLVVLPELNTTQLKYIHL